METEIKLKHVLEFAHAEYFSWRPIRSDAQKNEGPRNFKSSHRILMSIFKILGCFPFDVKNFRLDFGPLVYSILLQVAYSAAFGFVIRYTWYSEKEGNHVENFVKNTIVFQLGLGPILYFAFVLYKRTDLMRTVKELDLTDDLSTRGWTSFYGASMADLLLTFLTVALALYRDDKRTAAQGLCWAYICLYIKQFTGLLQPIKSALDRSIDLLHSPGTDLNAIADRYNSLRRCAHRLNSCYSQCLVLFSLCLFSQLVVTAYNCSKYTIYYIFKNEAEDVLEVSAAVASLVLYVVDMMHVAHECNTVSDKVG